MSFNSYINCLRISSDKHRGMRNYMEDELRVKFAENNGKKTYFLGVFDGHGGREASVYARSYLFNKIIEQPGFHDDDHVKIENLGGKVSTSSVPRVVWKRPLKNPYYITSENSITQHEYIPFLAIARALGDFWSFVPERKESIVSPEPDINYIDIVPDIHKFLLLASDGLWGVMNAK
ncbi:protein phosphatase 1D-like [Hydra vulgaris]|uniref:Protein phosphatase 1D-like n=1 Tax=Hydra vulgaris TaxID=6087 RepID=A0ABM4B1B8_HYDVU